MVRRATKSIFLVDWALILPVLYLTGIGLVILESIDQSLATVEFSMTTQYIALAIGFVLFIMLSRTDVSTWKRLAPWVYLLSIILLLVTPIVGETAFGSQRWIQLGSFQIQPSEIAKLGLIAILALLFTKRKKEVNKPWTILLSIIYVVIPTILVASQPDLGTAVIYLMLWFALVSASYLRKSTVFLIAIVVLLTIPITLPFLAEYQKDRINIFLNPDEDPRGRGYNTIQSSIAVGSGGLTGKGLDAGSQSQLNFLPSQHTDFIFAVMSEKLGFIGAISVIIAFCVLAVRLFAIAWSSQFQFGGYVALGVGILLSTQAIVNIGMNLGVIPITGLPLPFISFGGSHIITELALIGIVFSSNRPASYR